MPPRSLRSLAKSAPSGGLGARIVVAAVLAAVACPGWGVAQQTGGRTMPRRAESAPAAPRTGSRMTPPAAAQVRGTKAAAKGASVSAGRSGPQENAAASTRNRAPAAAVRQTAAVVTAEGGVVLAGHAVAAPECGECGRRGCGKCRLAGGRLDLPCNGRCEQGGCPAHCPVRPDQFGYYATRWRSWPGQNVKQAGQFDPATTPVVPPRSEVPAMADELTLPSQQDEAAPEDDEDDEDGDTEDAPGMSAGEDAADGVPPAAKGEGTEAVDPPKPVDTREQLQPERREDAKKEPPTETKAESTGASDAARPSDDSGAVTARPAGEFAGTAWVNLGRGTAAGSTTTPQGGFVRAAGPVGAAEGDGRADDRETSKFRSPAQKFVERNEPSAGRWRAKAAAVGGAGVDTAANPLRGVTAQPGNPLR